MTKSELYELFKIATGLSAVAAKEYVERLSDIMLAELLAGGEVPLPRIGKLAVKKVKARMGRNPKTKKPMEIPAHRRMIVKSGKELKKSLSA